MCRFASIVLLALATTTYARVFSLVQPTGTVALSANEANYTGMYRPQVHFSPPDHFMNDPNGLFLDPEGIYHLYYQFNPTGLNGGNQHWGHATSHDLYHWTNQPIAIYPPTSDTQVYSGSAVIDVNNTSGFFPNQKNGVVAVYTLNTPTAQVQEIAYSTDGGITFTRFAENPVIDLNNRDFRDPKVFWHGDTQRWVMTVSLTAQATILFYTSPDLKAWTQASNFTHGDLQGLSCECPNLIHIPVHDLDSIQTASMQDATANEEMDVYLLTISTGSNPRAPQGGSAIVYFTGTFNGTHFMPTDVDSPARLTDFGKDSYAGQFYSELPPGADALGLSWASNIQYAGSLPTASEGWRSSMSLPRRTFLTPVSGPERFALVSTPADLTPVLGVGVAKSLGNDTFIVDYSQVASNAVYLEANVTGLQAGTAPPSAALNFTFFSADSGESVSGGIAFGATTSAFLDRGNTHGFSDPNFTPSFSTAVLPRPDGVWTLAVVIDRSIIEVFVNGGVNTATATFFATQHLTLVEVSAAGLPEGVSASVAVHALRSGWEDA